MYFTPRAAQVRNVSVAVMNGLITLVVLLIAPLGLAAVLINTLLVMVATYLTATVADRIVGYLQGDRPSGTLGGNRPRQVELHDRTESSLDRPQSGSDLEQR
jgi:hypothetical protein